MTGRDRIYAFLGGCNHIRRMCDHRLERNDKPQFKTPNWTCTKCHKDFRLVKRAASPIQT
jgi:hypothetical protein